MMSRHHRRILALLCIFFIHSYANSQDRDPGASLPKAEPINYALVVGISNYVNLPQLMYADDDAYLFADYLVNSSTCKKSDVRLLTDSTATKPTFFKELKRMLDNSKSGDRVYIYFAGHGDVENAIETGFLLLYNCQVNNYPGTDAIDISLLERYVNAIVKKDVKVILITDACRSGKLAGGMEGANLTINAMSKNFTNVVKLLSCQPNQLSMERYYPDGGHGIFTRYCVMGLMGLADRDTNRVVTVREMDFYLDAVGKESNEKQIPKVEGNPTTTLSTYNKSINSVNLTSTGGNFRANATDSTSPWNNNPFYKKFRQLITQRIFTSGNENAYSTILSAQTASQPLPLIRIMKEELAVLLEDDAQSWMNKYLVGQLGSVDSAVAGRALQISRNMEVVEKLFDETDLRMKEIEAKRFFFQAYHLYKKRDRSRYIEALGLLNKADSIMPNQAWILNVIGIINLVLNNFAASEFAFKKAISIAPSWNFPANNIATLYMNSGRNEEAEKHYKLFLAIDSNDVYTLNNIGVFYWRNKRYQEAEQAYLRTLKLDSSIVNAWNNLALVYLKRNNIGEAERMLNHVLKVDPNFVALPYNFACLHAQKGNFDFAVEYLETALKKGYTDLEEMESESSFTELRKTEAYKKLIAKYK